MKNKDRVFLEEFAKGNKNSADIIPSPIGKALNARIIKLDDEGFRMTMAFEASEQMLNGANVIQGGQLTSMLDFAMALLIMHHLKPEQNVATISLSTDYLNPTKVGGLVAEAEITRMGRNISFAKASLRNNDQKLIASATANMMIIS